MRADYGLDAPPVVRNLTVAGVVSIAAGLTLYFLFVPTQATLATVLLICGLVSGACFLIPVGLLVWSSRVGKLYVRERLIDSLDLRGDETVLDVGCGRGLLLIAAARRLTRGKAVGIDLWRSVDQSGNRPEVTLANARAEGVAERVVIKTGDMRELPYPDGSMDVVISSLAIHNIPDPEGRARAVREIARVLKPNGRVALLDMECTAEYVRTLREAGWHTVEAGSPSYLMFPPVRIVRGTKPAQAS